MKRISVAIVDDHKLFREVLVTSLAYNDKIKITGEEGTVEGMLAMLKKIRPDVLLLDITLESESAMDAMPLIRKISPGTRIIAVSMHKLPYYAKKMLKSGAKGYVTKNSPLEEIMKSIQEVVKGNIYICEEIKDILTEDVLNSKPGMHSIKNLSAREIDVVTLLKEGASSKEISLALNISLRTVEAHRYNILKKLKLKNTTALLNVVRKSELGSL